MKGATRMVARRSWWSGISLVERMPGKAQAWLERSGAKAWPGSPKRQRMRSITKAARAG